MGCIAGAEWLLKCAPGLLVFTLALVVACGTAAPEPVTSPTSAPAQATGNTPVPTSAPSASEPAPTNMPAGATTPSGTLNVGLSELGTFSSHPKLNNLPALQILHSAPISEALLTFDADSQVVPLLAKSWSISDDYTTWTFNLEREVQFHKGYGELTAEDVVYSYENWIQNPFHSRTSVIESFWADPAGSVTTPDPYTVVVDSGAPIVDSIVYEFSTIASHGSSTSVVSKKQSDEVGIEAADQDIAASGPWEIVEHRSAEFWKMRAVEDHWRQTPQFAEMIFWEIPEESSRLAGFQTGNLDTFIMAFDSIPLVESVPDAKFMTVSNAGPMMIQIFGNYYVGLGTDQQRAGYDPELPWVSANPDVDSPEWENARKVRQALMAAIDTEAIIDTLLRGFGRPAVLHDYVSNEQLLDPDMKWEFDPDRASALLAEAGYPGGGFGITLIPAIRNAPAEVPVCEAIAEMWRDIGIDVRLQRIPYQTYRPPTVARSYDGASCFGGRTRQSPVQGFVLIQSGGAGSFGVEHPWLDEKTALAQSTIDPEARGQVEREIGRFLFDNAFGPLAIYSWDTVWPVGPRIEEWSKDVKNFDVRAMNGYEYIRHR
ncbi:MAG: ABC transporter substrate-binding protein [Chloroflexi bacterium]|nr:ABC transporter substrate-binding protein [Chloroflexota bacterium]